MSSPVFAAEPRSARQLTLDFDPGLLVHRSLRDLVAAGVYRRGLKVVAADLDVSPGNLSVALSDDPHRKFSVDDLERYIQVTGDKSRSTTWWHATSVTRPPRATRRWSRCGGCCRTCPRCWLLLG